MAEPSVIPVGERAFCRRSTLGSRLDGGTGERATIPFKPVPRPPSPRPKDFIAFDTEAACDITRSMPGFDNDRWSWVTQNLLFGFARIGSISNDPTTGVRLTT